MAKMIAASSNNKISENCETVYPQQVRALFLVSWGSSGIIVRSSSKCWVCSDILGLVLLKNNNSTATLE